MGYSYSLNEENYTGAEDTPEIAAAVAIQEEQETLEEGAPIWVGENEPIEDPPVNVEWLIDNARDWLCDNTAPEAVEDSLDLTPAELKSLGDCLTAVFHEYLRTVKKLPSETYWTVTKVKQYRLQAGKAVLQ